MSDQGQAVVPEEVGNKMDEILNAETETSEDVTEEAQEDVSAETDTDEEIVEDVVEDTTEETVESEDETVDASEEAGVTEGKVRPEQKAKPEPQRKTDDVVREKEEVEEIKFDLDPDLVDPQVKAALDKAAEVLNKQQKVINEEKKSLQLEREKAFETRVDSCFDSYEKELPRLGDSSKLTEDNSKYRREIFQYADVTARIHGISIEDAIKDTVQMFKNKEGEKAIEKRLIAKLNKQKGKFTNPPTRKKSDVNSRKFASEAERVRAKMNDAFKKAGIT